MRYLTTLLFAALSFSAVGQGIPQLPYNPDATEDGFIGSPDLLELLSLYGEEFSSAILSEDQESAIVYMGNSDIFSCRLSCSVLPGNWWLMTIDEAGLVIEDLELLLDDDEVWIESTYSTNSYPLGILKVNGGDGLIMTTTNRTLNQNRCYCATKELPRVEYKIITYNSIQYVEASINTQAQEGWRVMAMAPPNDNNSSPFPVTLWRWAE